MMKVAEVEAKSLTQILLRLGELQNQRLDSAYILSQCYDGASVMSGAKRGVQNILQDTLNRKLPHVHCYNHQLHLVVTHAMEAEAKVENFFPIFANSCMCFSAGMLLPTHMVAIKLMDVLSRQVPTEDIGMACRNAPEDGAAAAIRRARLA